MMLGNGSHKAVAEVFGCYYYDQAESYLLFPDGTKITATPRREKDKPNYLGIHCFRAYPTMKMRKLVSLLLIGFDKEKIAPNEQEFYLFRGVWKKGRLVVERDAKICRPPLSRKKYWFVNYHKVKGSGNLVEIKAVRSQDKFIIQTVKTIKYGEQNESS